MWSGNLRGEFREVSPISPSSDGHEFVLIDTGGVQADLHIENFELILSQNEPTHFPD